MAKGTEKYEALETEWMEKYLGTSNQCDVCKHYKGEDICKAFPNGGIPIDIITDDFIHNEIHPEQQTTIVFEEIEVE